MKIPVLLYHSVSDDATNLYRPWAISPALFEQHMAHLVARGYQPVTVSQMVESVYRKGGKELQENPVVITFDDGLADFQDVALPILRKYGFPSTLFLTTGYVGLTSQWLADLGEHDRPMLTWEQIRAMQDVEIGAHSHTHPQLDLLPIQDARREIFSSRQIIEENTGKAVLTFAFPHGYHTAKLLELVSEAGYSSACVVGHAMAGSAENIFSIPRIIVTSDVTAAMLEQYLQGIGLRRRGLLHNSLRRAWRVYRFIGSRRSAMFGSSDSSRSFEWRRR